MPDDPAPPSPSPDPLAALRRQYEAYPYPERDPADEARRLITGSPSHLDELVHYVFAGHRPAGRPFRILFAGGGTGDGLIMLAQQCADAGLSAEITYLDLSAASHRVAEARAAARRLSGAIRFITGSLLDVARLAPGPFDYIDCCGVLHHLPDPAAGLAALAGVLSPLGGMGLMLYAPYGRSGVYPLQAALRRLTRDCEPADQVRLAREVLDALPETNLFRRNPFLADHRRSDAGLFDLLLHSRDRPFTIAELAALVAGCGLAISGFAEPLRYDPRLLLPAGAWRRRVAALDPLEQAALAEQLAGNIKAHVVYAVPAARAATAVAQPTADAIPVLRELDGAAIARTLRPGQAMTVDHDGLRLRLPLPPLAGPLLAGIDGRRTIGMLRDAAGDRDGAQFARLYRAFNGAGKLFLRH